MGNKTDRARVESDISFGQVMRKAWLSQMSDGLRILDWSCFFLSNQEGFHVLEFVKYSKMQSMSIRTFWWRGGSVIIGQFDFFVVVGNGV